MTEQPGTGQAPGRTGPAGTGRRLSPRLRKLILTAHLLGWLPFTWLVAL